MTTTARLVHVTPTPTAEALGRAFYEAEDPYPFPGVTWDTVPESFRKLYIHYGTKAEATLRAAGVRAVAPLPVIADDLLDEIWAWREWWESGRVEQRRTTRKAHEILLDLAERAR